MGIIYSHKYYTNPRIMGAEEKILQYFSQVPLPKSKDELMNLTGESWNTVERALKQIRRYSGYTVSVTKRGGTTKYQVCYSPVQDKWAYLNVGAV